MLVGARGDKKCYMEISTILNSQQLIYKHLHGGECFNCMQLKSTVNY